MSKVVPRHRSMTTPFRFSSGYRGSAGGHGRIVTKDSYVEILGKPLRQTGRIKRRTLFVGMIHFGDEPYGLLDCHAALRAYLYQTVRFT